MGRKKGNRRAASRSWDAVANWYLGWSGAEGSRHHRELAIPALVSLLLPQPDEAVLDIGCGAGALAPAILTAGAGYTGIDKSPKLIAHARRHHARQARFVVGDATRLAGTIDTLFDAAAFLLSIQDIDPLDAALRSAASALKPGGRLVMLMTHPCFRIPRQSGWGWDEARGLRFRRVDRYLSALDIPMQEYGGTRAGVTRSYHRPLEAYISALAAAGFIVEAMKEVPAAYFGPPEREARALRLARQEFPLFLGLRARKA